MVIDGVMWFDGAIDFELLRAVIQRRMVDYYPVFSQRPVAAGFPFGMPPIRRARIGSLGNSLFFRSSRAGIRAGSFSW